MITNGFTYIAFLTFLAGTIAAMERRYKSFALLQIVPTPVILYLACMILATFDFWTGPEIAVANQTVRTAIIPAMIFIMLLQCDISKITRIGPRLLLGFFCAMFSIIAGFAITFYFMKGEFPETAPKTFGALAGSWIGGSSNMVAIQDALNIPDNIMGPTLLVDNIEYASWSVLLLGTVPFAKYFNAWTNADTSIVDSIGENLDVDLSHRRTKPEASDIAFLLGLGFAVAAISINAGRYFSPILTRDFGASDFFSASTITIILATLLGLFAAMTKLSTVPGSSQVSIPMLYILICLIASRSSFKDLTSAPMYLVAGLLILVIHAILMAVMAKIFKMDLFTCATASLANIGGVAAAPIIAAAYKETLVPAGVLMGLLGYACGTFGGLFVAQILSMM